MSGRVRLELLVLALSDIDLALAVLLCYLLVHPVRWLLLAAVVAFTILFSPSHADWTPHG